MRRSSVKNGINVMPPKSAWPQTTFAWLTFGSTRVCCWKNFSNACTDEWTFCTGKYTTHSFFFSVIFVKTKQLSAMKQIAFLLPAAAVYELVFKESGLRQTRSGDAIWSLFLSSKLRQPKGISQQISSSRRNIRQKVFRIHAYFQIFLCDFHSRRLFKRWGHHA